MTCSVKTSSCGEEYISISVSISISLSDPVAASLCFPASQTHCFLFPAEKMFHQKKKSVLFFFFFFCLFGAVQLCSLTWWNGRLLWPKTRKRGATRLIENSRAGQRKLPPAGGERFILSWPETWVNNTWRDKQKLVRWTDAWHWLPETCDESSETRVILNYIGDQLIFPSAGLIGHVSRFNPMITRSLMTTRLLPRGWTLCSSDPPPFSHRMIFRYKWHSSNSQTSLTFSPCSRIKRPLVWPSRCVCSRLFLCTSSEGGASNVMSCHQQHLNDPIWGDGAALQMCYRSTVQRERSGECLVLVSAVTLLQEASRKCSPQRPRL